MPTTLQKLKNQHQQLVSPSADNLLRASHGSLKRHGGSITKWEANNSLNSSTDLREVAKNEKGNTSLVDLPFLARVDQTVAPAEHDDVH